MVKETSLAGSMDAVGIRAQYDEACKKLLSNKEILAWILQSTVKEFKDCDVKDIAGNYIEGMPEVSTVLVNPGESNANITGMNSEDTVYREGKIAYDIRFQALYPCGDDAVKVFINVEAQKNYYPGYAIPTRGIFYCCRMISSQYDTEFTEPDYDDIKKVYSIWICLNVPKKAENTIVKYHMAKEDVVGVQEDKPETYDLISVIMLCLGSEVDDGYQSILKLLGVLFSNEKTLEEKKNLLETEYGIAMHRELEKEVNVMCNLSEGVEARGFAKGEAKVEARLVAMIRRKMEKGLDAATAADQLELEEAYVKQVMDMIGGSPDDTDLEVARILVGQR